MPSSVSHDQIPHSIILPNQPLFCLSPRVFGCVCFVHITPRQDKLSTKATKCVFLGYSRLHRGYRCYSTDTNRYFISVDVTFFEGSSFFSFEEHPHVSNVLHVPFVLPPPDFPSPPMDAMTRPLQVYTCHPCPLTRLLPIHLLCHCHLLLPFRNCLIIYLLPFEKVLALLVTHILFIIL